LFRKQGLFVGSGVIEAGCKTLIATRLKRSGMFWKPFAVPMRSSLSVAAVTVVNSTIIGSPDGHECPFQVAHPQRSEIHRAVGRHTALVEEHAYLGEGVVRIVGCSDLQIG
jgi:hypothetical protein